MVLILLVFAFVKSILGLRKNAAFGPSDKKIILWTVICSHIQLVIGIILYFVSPLISQFMQDFKKMVHVRDVRFFGMEHSSMMLLAIIFITIGSAKSKRKTEDKAKHKTIAIWFGIALLLILVNIPWPFSPFATRPLIP